MIWPFQESIYNFGGFQSDNSLSLKAETWHRDLINAVLCVEFQLIST